MVSRCRFSKSSEIGAYCLLTNTYALVPYCNDSFIQHFSINLPETLPIIQTNVANTSIIGRMCVGNTHGIIFPSTITEKELKTITNQLPEEVEVATTDDPFSALGNVISCNDKIALVNPSLDSATIEMIQDTLMVEAIPISVGSEGLVGTYTKFTNKGGIVFSNIPAELNEQLSSHLGFELVTTYVNRGSNLVAAGVCANDYALICGMDTTALEISNISRAFRIETAETTENEQSSNIFSLESIRKLIEI